MYVADIDSLDELIDMEREALNNWNIHPTEQNGWDLEDIRERIEELKQEARWNNR